MRTGLRSSQKNYASSMATPPLTPKLSYAQGPCHENSDTNDTCRKRAGASLIKSSPSKKKQTKTSPLLSQHKDIGTNKNEMSCDPLILEPALLIASSGSIFLDSVFAEFSQAKVPPTATLDIKVDKNSNEECNILALHKTNDMAMTATTTTTSPSVSETYTIPPKSEKKTRRRSPLKTRLTKTKHEKDCFVSLIKGVTDAAVTITKKRRKPLTKITRILPKGTLLNENHENHLSPIISRGSSSHKMSIWNLINHEEQTERDFKTKDEPGKYTPQETTAAQVIAGLYREYSIPRMDESHSLEQPNDQLADSGTDYFSCGYLHNLPAAEYYSIEKFYNHELYLEGSNASYPTVPIQVPQDVIDRILAMQQSIYDWGFRDGMLQRIQREM